MHFFFFFSRDPFCGLSFSMSVPFRELGNALLSLLARPDQYFLFVIFVYVDNEVLCKVNNAFKCPRTDIQKQ